MTPAPSYTPLSPTDGKAAFHIFLKSEFCEENIEFWTACEDFKALASHKDQVSKADSIFEEFIKSESPKEVLYKLPFAYWWFKIPIYVPPR